MNGASGGRRLPGLAVIAIASLICCSSAQAATVTVGSPLTASFTPGYVGTGGILGANLGLGEPGAQAASPVDGAVIGWKLLGEGGPFVLRVTRSEAAGTFLAVAASAPQTIVATYGLGTFTTDLPIEAGETVGIQAVEKARIGTAVGDATGSTAATWATAPESSAAVPDGGAPDSELAFNATVLPAPTIASVTPTSGPVTGGTSVSVSGTDFTDVQGVSFGSVPAAAYSVNSEGRLTAFAPPAVSAGAVPVSVTTEAGTAVSAQSFTYSAPPAPVSTGGPPPTPPVQPLPECVVPKLQGKKLKAVRKTLAKADCKLGRVTKLKGAKPKSGLVVSQDPLTGMKLAAGAKVAVKLAPGPA